ncbi:aspartic peptidase domain-containing protein [Halteromyces radiatus]|uniref:aspartic peptidase domain-containing protein n=1 Tax=Halteromyces radiatus TaxID=101107 RepID=UPI00221EFF6C|nr:aspartic peptidase domain-containing protein [Halteromyces radiatus]KAI8096982.1 aspartic peptidase domain-containing protein [Halteromyces radiatus]
MYLLLIFLWCFVQWVNPVFGTDNVHIIPLHSYRTSSSLSSSRRSSKLAQEDNHKQSDGLIASLLSKESSDENTKGVATLESDNDVLWYTILEVGTGERRQQFTVDVDTGSADLFLPGTDCDDSCDGHGRYDPKHSSTSEDTSQPFELNFADKTSVKGTIYTDTVSLGGLEVNHQGFGVAELYSRGMEKDIFRPDGLLGLGFKQLSHLGTEPLLDNLYKQGKIKQRAFGIRLDMTSEGEKGELTLGGYNEHHIDGPIAHASVTSDTFWQIQLDSVSLNSQVIGTKQQMIVDTGSTLINADPIFVKKFYSKVKGARRPSKGGHWIMPCANIPTIEFTISGIQFPISPYTFSPGRVDEGSDLCYGGMVANSKRNDPWIVGGVFLANVYAIFDADKKTIGFSRLKNQNQV